MDGEGVGLPVETQAAWRWLRQYVRLRWLAIGAILFGALAARTLLGIGVSLFPMLIVSAAIASTNVLLSIWQQRHERHALEPELIVRLRQRLAFAHIVADIIALTVLLHFVGGIDTPFFLFYFFHVGLGSIMLSRRNAYKIMALAMGLFVLLVGIEFLGWLPHVHLEGAVPLDLYRRPAYVATVLIGFVLALTVSTIGTTTVMTELRRRQEQQARTNERELEKISQKLAELDRMRTFFLGLASHDLKTPLAVVANYLQAILDGFVGEANEKQRRWMERANVRILELIRLINDFLDVSQLAPERVLIEMERVSLSDIVQRSVEEVRAGAEEKSVTVRVELPSQLPPVYAAPRRLQQVITNLLDNAVKFSPRQREVLLEAHQHGDGIRVVVTDAGPGIPTLYMPHVFEDYFRARRKEFVPGAGLGLSTARKIVEAHGGEIWVQSPCSEDGKGSRFLFTLPGGQRDEADARLLEG